MIYKLLPYKNNRERISIWSIYVIWCFTTNGWRDHLLCCTSFELTACFSIALENDDILLLTDVWLNQKNYHKRYGGCFTINEADNWLEPVEFLIEISYINNLNLLI